MWQRAVSAVGGGGGSITMTAKNTYSHGTSNPVMLDFSDVVNISKLVVDFKLHAAGYPYVCNIMSTTDGINYTQVGQSVNVTADVTYTVPTPFTSKGIKFSMAGSYPQFGHVNGWEIEY